jgi:hypothetical protein
LVPKKTKTKQTATKKLNEIGKLKKPLQPHQKCCSTGPPPPKKPRSSKTPDPKVHP